MKWNDQVSTGILVAKTNYSMITQLRGCTKTTYTVYGLLLRWALSICLCMSALVCVCVTWRNGHVVLFWVAPSHGAHTVEAVGCDDRVGLGQGCEGCCGCGGGLGQAQRRRGFRGRLGQRDTGHEIELRGGRANSWVNHPCVFDTSLAPHICPLIAGEPKMMHERLLNVWKKKNKKTLEVASSTSSIFQVLLSPPSLFLCAMSWLLSAVLLPFDSVFWSIWTTHPHIFHPLWVRAVWRKDGGTPLKQFWKRRVSPTAEQPC